MKREAWGDVHAVVGEMCACVLSGQSAGADGGSPCDQISYFAPLEQIFAGCIYPDASELTIHTVGGVLAI